MASNILGSLLLLIKTKGDTSGLDKTNKSLLRTNNTLKKVHRNTSMLGKLSNSIFGGFNLSTLSYGFNSYLKFEKDIGAMKSRFFAVTHDEKQAEEEFDYIRKLATDTAMDIKKTADSYSIFSSATFKNLGREGARGVFEDWTRVSRVLHLTPYQFERVTYALREMASKGAIYSQDLRMQIGTHVPNAMGLAQQAAEEMGITGVDWFEKLQKSAKGNTKVTSKFVQLFSKYARQAFGSEEAFKKAMQQPDALAKQISNIGYNFMVDFSKAGGSYMIVKILEKVSQVLLSIDYNKLTKTLGSIARGVGDIFNYLPQILNALKVIAVGYVAMKTGKMVAGGIYGLATLKRAYGIVSKYGARAFKHIGTAGLGKLLMHGGFSFALKDIISKALTGVGIKAWAKVGLRFIPVVGQILTVITTVATIIGIIKSFITKEKGSFYEATGVTPDQVYNVLKNIKDDQQLLDSPYRLEKMLNNDTVGKKIAKYVYVDNGEVKIDFNGNFLTLDDIKNSLDIADKEKQDKQNKANNMFNKPTTVAQEKTYKIRGY